MLFEFITIFPLIINAFKTDHSTSSGEIIVLLFYLKFSQFAKMKNKLEDRFNTSHTFVYMFDLFELLGTLLIFLHFAACVWIYIGKYEKSIGENR